MDLDHAAQRPLHGWYVILPEDYYGAYSDVVTALAPFISDVQLVQVFSMPTAPEMLFDPLNMLPAGETIGWGVPEISFSKAC